MISWRPSRYMAQIPFLTLEANQSQCEDHQPEAGHDPPDGVDRFGDGRTTASHRRAGGRPGHGHPQGGPGLATGACDRGGHPAIETGIPETAEVVIGGLVVPSPIPKSR